MSFIHHRRNRIALTIIAIAALATRAGAQTTPAGFWNTISDVDGRPTAVVEIQQINGEYVGTVRALLVAADPEDSVCGKCKGAQKGQRIIGMEIIHSMRPDGDEWSGGEVLDPETGKTYRARMKLTDGGQKLVLRGYIGLPLFGRSQTWVRRSQPPN